MYFLELIVIIFIKIIGLQCLITHILFILNVFPFDLNVCCKGPVSTTVYINQSSRASVRNLALFSCREQSQNSQGWQLITGSFFHLVKTQMHRNLKIMSHCHLSQFHKTWLFLPCGFSNRMAQFIGRWRASCLLSEQGYGWAWAKIMEVNSSVYFPCQIRHF